MELPTISINISVRNNENASIVLESLQKINYPDHLIEIVLIKGGHLTKQRNLGIQRSKGEIIYLLDNDSVVKPNALRVIAREFKRKNIAVVGGPSLTPKTGSYFSTVIGYILATYFGAFRMRFKWSNYKKIVAPNDYHFIGCNLAFRKKIVKKIGGFDEHFKANDETELLRRIKDKGYRLVYTPNLVVYKGQRTNPISLMKQFHHYGKGRMQHLLKNPKNEDIFLLAPIGFIIYISTLFFFRPRWYELPLFCYGGLGLLTGMKASVKHKRPDLILVMNLLFPLIHISYGIGLIHEFLHEQTIVRYKKLSKKSKRMSPVRLQVVSVQMLAENSRNLLSKNEVI